MDVASFEFTMTLPGDTRLVGAVRDLAAHAAKYAMLAEPAAAALADRVAKAAETVIATTGGQDAPVEVRFTGGGSRLQVEVTREAPASGAVPESSSEPGLTITWTRSGSRQTCLIAHRLAS